MELVYLWVENYKNIQKQGFNFSTRFECEFKDKYDSEGKLKDNCELVINPKEHLENFFGKNINITAIVGENGSGKSSIVTLLEEIESFTCELYPKHRHLKFIILFQKEDAPIQGYSNIKNICQYNLIKYKSRMQENINEFPSSETKVYRNENSQAMGRISYINPCLFDDDFSFLTLFSEMPYPYENARKLKINKNKTISYESNNIANLAIKNSDKNFTFELTTFMRYPKIIYLQDNEVLKNRLVEELLPIEAVYSNNPKNGSPYPDCYDKRKDLNPNNALEAFMINRIIKEADLCIEFFNVYSSYDDEDELQEFYDNNEYELNEEEYNLTEYEELISRISYNIKEITPKINSLIDKYDKFLLYDFEDNKNRRFSDLSHGEKSIYAQFISICDVINNSKNSLIILDEPDLSLHPTWQKNYIKELDNTFFKLNTKIHFILTMHSPFLLSDLPKETIIFLKKDKKTGNCKNVTQETKINPFGANIHTLLSHGFFMEDGLMGEFAKTKINEIIGFLNGKKKIEDISTPLSQIKKVIDSIGEPFLQAKVEQMYESKFGLDDELVRLEKQQTNINLKIQELKKQKSEDAKS